MLEKAERAEELSAEVAQRAAEALSPARRWKRGISRVKALNRFRVAGRAHALSVPMFASTSAVTAAQVRTAISTRRYPFVWRKGVLNGYSSRRVSLWDSLMFGRLAMRFANVRAGTRVLANGPHPFRVSLCDSSHS